MSVLTKSNKSNNHCSYSCLVLFCIQAARGDSSRSQLQPHDVPGGGGCVHAQADPPLPGPHVPAGPGEHSCFKIPQPHPPGHQQ